MRTRFTLVFTLLLAGAPAVSLAAAHRARLSADLQDHLTAGSQVIDVIVHGDRSTVDALAARYNLVVARYLSSGAVLRVTAGQLAALQQDDALDHLSGNTPIRVSDAVTAESTGADQVWAGSREVPALTGAHVTVAVIDSGMDPNHAALKGRIVATRDFTGGDGVDRFGHGTHVAGIIAGGRVTTPDGLDYRGMAYGANLVNLRVLDANGAGTVADVVEAIDWVVAHRDQYHIRIINLSLGAPVLQPFADDPLCEAVERAVRAGVVVVASAGNYGRNADGKTVLGSITSPANSPHAIAVGAIDTHGTPERSDDTIASYSSRGPTAYDLLLKPDLAAPGQHIVSAEASNAYLPTTYPSHHVTGQGANAYFQLSGTSMSAAVVSGAAALLLDERPGLGPGDTKAALQLTSTFMPEAGLVGAGAGNMNVLAAVDLVDSGQVPATTVIEGEKVSSSDIATSYIGAGSSLVFAPRIPRLSNALIVPGGATPVWSISTDTAVWSIQANTAVWSIQANTAVWSIQANTAVWSIQATTVVWGNVVEPSTAVWSIQANTVVWGNAVEPCTAVWSIQASTVVWGNAVEPSTAVWSITELPN